MLVFLLLGIISLAAGTKWDYVNDLKKCSILGPKYWCLSTKHASSCHATSYCKEHVWSKQLQSAQQDICTTCEQYVGTIHMLLENKETEDEILKAMKSACSVLPETVQAMCSEAVDAYGKELVDAVVQYTADPKQLCSLIGLCKSNKLPKLKFGSDYCMTCQQYLGTLHMLLSNEQTQKEVISVLKSFCSYVPTQYSAECSLLMETTAPYMLKWLVNYTADPSVFCKMIGLCPSRKISLVNKHNDDVVEFSRPVYTGPGPVIFPNHEGKMEKTKLPAKEVKKIGGPYCETCLQIVKIVDDRLDSKPTHDEVKKLLDEACSILGSYSEECSVIVNDYSDSIIDAFVKGILQPNEICMLLKLCPAAKTIDTVNAKAPSKLSLSKVRSGVTCEVCEYAVGYLDNTLKDNRTEEAIREALDNVCGYVPSRYGQECQELVNTYTDTLVELLVQELDPSIICKELGLCSTVKGSPKKVFSLHNQFECEVCQYVMGKIEELLKDNRSEAAIEEALDKVCSYVPSEYQEKCTEYVTAFGPIIRNLLIQELEPQLICKELNLCSAVRVKESELCEICQYAMGYLDGVLKDKATQEEIEAAVDQLCNHLPQYLNDECKSLVAQYGPTIISLLVKELDPSTVCHALNLCQSSHNKQQNYMQALQLSLSGPSCTVCEYAMGYLDSELDSKPVKKEIEALVEDLCNHLPSSLKNECDALITEYGDKMIDLLVKELKPDVICKELHVC